MTDDGRDSVAMRAFWEDVHRRNETLYLAASHPMAVYQQHNIVRQVMGKPIRIIEIGVGTGDSIRQLVQFGHRVTAVDIADAALAKVKLWCEAVRADVFAEGHVVVGEADLILCHLVTQHCDDRAFHTLVASALRHLKQTTGLFSFQYAFRRDGAMPAWLQAGVDEGVLFWRSDAEVDRIVDLLGGKIAWASPPIFFPEQDAVGWRILHVTKP